MVLLDGSTERKAENAAVVKAHTALQTLLTALKAATTRSEGVDAQELRLLGDFEAVEAKYGPLALKIVGMALNDQRDAAVQL